MQFRVYTADALDPYWNLAAEEWFLDQAAQHDPVLFLWRSQPAVIIGKNQNPWRECDISWIADQNVLLARRSSGGGAVYHDEGNLNYAFFMRRESYQPDAIYALVIAVLADLGIQASRWNRTSLIVDAYKCSGSAFCLRRNVAMHHGTLLIDADLHRLSRALHAPDWKISTKATPSVPAPVRNLADWDPTLSVERVQGAFIHRLAAQPAELIQHGIQDVTLVERVKELRSSAWLWDRTPPFEARVPVGHGRGQRRVLVRVEAGCIVAIDDDECWLRRPFAEWLAQLETPSGQGSE